MHFVAIFISGYCIVTVIMISANTVISTSHSISSVLFIYMYWLAFCHAI